MDNVTKSVPILCGNCLNWDKQRLGCKYDIIHDGAFPCAGFKEGKTMLSKIEIAHSIFYEMCKTRKCHNCPYWHISGGTSHCFAKYLEGNGYALVAPDEDKPTPKKEKANFSDWLRAESVDLLNSLIKRAAIECNAQPISVSMIRSFENDYEAIVIFEPKEDFER